MHKAVLPDRRAARCRARAGQQQARGRHYPDKAALAAVSEICKEQGGGSAAGQGISSKKGSAGDYSRKQGSGSSSRDSVMESSSSQGSSTSGPGSGSGGY